MTEAAHAEVIPLASCICFALQRGVESRWWDLDGSGRRGDVITGIGTLGHDCTLSEIQVRS